MQSKKGSATVPVALFGVSPNRWGGRLHTPNGTPRRLLLARRRDADGSGRDDRAPHLQLHRSGMKWLSADACAGSKTGASASHAASRRGFLSSRRVGPAVEAVTLRLAGFTSNGRAGETVRNFATIDGKCFKR